MGLDGVQTRQQLTPDSNRVPCVRAIAAMIDRSLDEHAAPGGENPEQQDAFHDDGCFDPESIRRR